MSHTFVTGGLGCIGSWVVRNLVEAGEDVTCFDISDWPHRLRLNLGDDDIAKVNMLQGDVTDGEQFTKAVLDSGATRIIHLAAFQVPLCKAHPARGSAVNVEGTVNAFEAAKAAGIDHIVYASSVAVFGRHDEYDTKLLMDDSTIRPHTLYGIWKAANEETARVYWQDHQISSFALRPYTVYGPARDTGMTSSPTTALLSAIQGKTYEITYGGENGFQFVDDIAKLFILGNTIKTEGAEAVNVGGEVAHMSEVVAAIEAAVPEATGLITHKEQGIPLPAGQDDSRLRALLGDDIPNTSLADGMQRAVEQFRNGLETGRLVLPT